MTTLINRVLVAGSFLCSIALTGCVSQSSYDSLQAQNMQLEQQVAAQSAQHSETQSQLEAKKVQVTRLQGAIKYTIESDLLFPSGSWKISDDGKEIIGKMAKKLAPTQNNKLVVNGYTDDAPIGPGLEKKGVSSNQELSEKRAEAVKDLLISKGVPPDKVIAVGHGPANPVAKNDSREGRSQNRRVELTQQGG
ncbi:MAG TPA: OmpA family protein [Kofleriaceae bacterium]|nr:OmpA family protein [Kofleriaceae bacterium]